MLKNADVTFYNFADYARHVESGVYYSDERGKTVNRNGITIQNCVMVYLYPGTYMPNPGDVIVKGVCNFTFTATTEATVSASMATFRTQNPDFAVVESVRDCRYGGLPHVEITAR